MAGEGERSSPTAAAAGISAQHPRFTQPHMRSHICKSADKDSVGQPAAGTSPPSPSRAEMPTAALGPDASTPPASSKDAHIKTHHRCTTKDGWKLHLVRTQSVDSGRSGIGAGVQGPPPRRCPVLLVPGLGSSGSYTFDLSPVISVADWLASQGWDVWTAELRGNGQSDRPKLFVRSRWWTIDDLVEKDVPAVLSYVRRVTGADQVHVVGHSMGGMILTRLLALGGEAAAAVASATIVGSSVFLQGSWWQALERIVPIARVLWAVPMWGIQAYSPLALGRAGLALVDQLYFWPPNTDPALARAVLARNFSTLSSGVLLQLGSGFAPPGLRTADRRELYADPARLAAVSTPIFFMCGDRDRMCPPRGARAHCQLFTGSRCARFMAVGPRSGTRHHYGHFDILMGRHVEEEVFPLLNDWFESHDACDSSTTEYDTIGGRKGRGLRTFGGREARAGVGRRPGAVVPPRKGEGEAEVAAASGRIPADPLGDGEERGVDKAVVDSLEKVAAEVEKVLEGVQVREEDGVGRGARGGVGEGEAAGVGVGMKVMGGRELAEEAVGLAVQRHREEEVQEAGRAAEAAAALRAGVGVAGAGAGVGGPALQREACSGWEGPGHVWEGVVKAGGVATGDSGEAGYGAGGVGLEALLLMRRRQGVGAAPMGQRVQVRSRL